MATTALEATFVGSQAGFNNTTGAYNTFLGEACGSGNTGGSYNTYVGNSTAVNNATGGYNTICGYEAAYGSGGNNHNNNSIFGYHAAFTLTSGSNNVMMGYQAGRGISTGAYNVFVGSGAADSHTTGSGCVFVGYLAGQNNTTASNNTFIGYKGGYSNLTGDLNTSLGGYTLYTNLTGVYNTAIGYQALYLTNQGSHNNALGVNSGYSNSTGSNNVFIGEAAGAANTTGAGNTFLGYGADANAGTYSNCGAIGNGAIITASNKIYMGNASVLGLYNFTGLYTTSDGRFKSSVTENVKGLAFINELRPVTYKLETKLVDDFIIQNMPDSVKTAHQIGMDFAGSKAVVHSGFIAQEVEAAALSVGFPSSIVSVPSNGTDPYSLNYAEIVVPLVKAVQELSKAADSTAVKDSINEAKLEALQNQVNQLAEALNTCCSSNHSMLQNNNSNSGSSIDVNLKDGQSVILEQNVPNPFAEQTTINYFLPENVLKAQMLFYNVLGKLIQSVDLNGKGKGSINVFAQDLSNGTYTYTIVVDGKIMETKKMVKQ